MMKGGNVLEFPIAGKKREIGFNITISDRQGSYSLVPENFGILKLGNKSQINQIIPKAIIFGTDSRNYSPLWIENSSSSLFDEKDNYISYDSSVC
jgi:hypothetical protein